MDIRIENNDIKILPDGTIKTVSGIEEVLQKILIAAKIPRGSFIYDRNLGAFDGEIENDDTAKIEMLLNEAFINTEVSVKVNYADGGVLGLTVFDGHKNYETEVKVFG